jgi:Lon-like ATP-dependent protease
MHEHYGEKDYRWIKELMDYPKALARRLDFMRDTSQIDVPVDPIEKVIFQDRAKTAIRKIAQNKGHILLVGKPGTGKSLLADMFEKVLTQSMGDYLAPKEAIIAYPGKDRNHIRFAYEDTQKADALIDHLGNDIEKARNSADRFSLAEVINSARRARKGLLITALIAAAIGLIFSPAFIITGLAGMGAIFMFMQENNHKAQEKIQQEADSAKLFKVKHLFDMVPEILFDPRKSEGLMARVSEPDARKMKGGFRHDPYQSSGLQTPAHKRAYLGAHAKAPIIYIDELKTLIRAGYMADMLEIMQNKRYLLEGGQHTGSGAADRSENFLRASNIILACCNHDTLAHLRREGDGAFLSRIEDKGEVIQMETAVPETARSIHQVGQYVRQEVLNLGHEFRHAWGDIIQKEGYEGIRKRSETIFGRELPPDFTLKERDFSSAAVLEIVKELRCRASDGKLSGVLRPINGIIRSAEFEAIITNSDLVEPFHVQSALKTHFSLEGELAREMIRHKKDLKKYIDSMTDSIGYVVGLAVVNSGSSGRMYGQPLPIHCQINAGSAGKLIAPGKIGEIARAASLNVRASIKKVLQKIGAPYVGYEMHVEYIQAHGGVEGDSASVAIDIGLISDFIKRPVNQKFGVTGSLTGEIILSVGGVTEKIRSIMEPQLGMAGACIPWQNKHDVEPLLINAEYCYTEKAGIPGIRIFRSKAKQDPFEIYFCKTKYHAYQILMGIDRVEVENLMAARSQADLRLYSGRKQS